MDAWRQMLVGKTVHALQFHDELFLNHQIGHRFADVLPFVAHRKSHLRFGAYTTQRELPDHGPFLDLLQESGAQHIGNLEGGPDHGLCQIRFRSVCIRVHPWPSVALLYKFYKYKFCKRPRNLTRRARNLATDGRGYTQIPIVQLCRGRYTSG